MRPITVRLEPADHARLRIAAANAGHRGMDSFVRALVLRYLDRNQPAVAGEVVAGAPTREDGGPSALRGSVSTRVSTLPPSRPELPRREVTPNLKRQP